MFVHFFRCFLVGFGWYWCGKDSFGVTWALHWNSNSNSNGKNGIVGIRRTKIFDITFTRINDRIFYFCFEPRSSLLHFALHNWQWRENDAVEMEKYVKMKSALFMRLGDKTTTTFQRDAVSIFFSQIIQAKIYAKGSKLNIVSFFVHAPQVIVAFSVRIASLSWILPFYIQFLLLFYYCNSSWEVMSCGSFHFDKSCTEITPLNDARVYSCHVQ